MCFFTALLLGYFDNKSVVIRQAGTTVTHQDWRRILVITCIGLKQMLVEGSMLFKHMVHSAPLGRCHQNWPTMGVFKTRQTNKRSSNIPLAKLEGKWKFKDIHSDTFSLQVSWRMEDLHYNCTDWQIAFCVKSTFFSTPQDFSIPRDSHSRLQSSK